MMTTVGGIWAVARCKWCDKPAFSVQGGKGQLVRFKCADRGCHMDNELTLV